MKTLLLAFAITAGLCAQDSFRVKVSGDGPAMILIPGLASSGDVWDSTVRHYRNQFQCHVLTVAGFAGLPRVPAPMLDRVRDDLAAYIREKKLERPLIVGHSLGGYLALALAAKYPEMPGRLIIVDAYPFADGLANPKATAEDAKKDAEQMRQFMSQQSQDDYERFIKSGLSTRPMVTRDADLQTIIKWGLASDRTAVTDAMAEMFGSDLRPDLPRIKSSTLVLASWVGMKQYTDRARTAASLRQQYANLGGVEIRITDTARHFIMWDDPEWMFAQMDGFLGTGKQAAR